MKSIKILFLLLVSFQTSKAQWETVYFTWGTPKIPFLSSVEFTDINNGMAVGSWYDTLNLTAYYPIILRTTDSGTNWDTVYSSVTPGGVSDIEFIDNVTAIAVGGYNSNSGFIGRTADFGNTWTITNTASMGSVHFPSYQTGYAAGSNIIMKSVDAGLTWSNIQTLPSPALRSVFFINDTVGFSIGDTTIYKTVDGGNNWTDIKLPYAGYLQDLHFPSDSVGYTFMTFGFPTTMYKTTDCGITWNQLPIINNSTSLSVLFTNDNVGYIASILSIKKTTDGGFTWTEQESSPPSFGSFMDAVADVYFLNDTIGFAVGNNQFYRTYNGGELLTTHLLDESSNSISFHIYPNPSTGSFNIVYQLPNNSAWSESADGKFEIFDITGKIVFEMKLSKWTTFQQISLPTRINNGLYNCIITSGGHRMSKKIAIANH